MIAPLLSTIDAVAATNRPAHAVLPSVAAAGVFAAGVGPTWSRDAEGGLRMTTRCFVLLTLVGLVVGLLSGLFGVGGGFLIVPALVAAFIIFKTWRRF
jgi:hypothetical protein